MIRISGTRAQRPIHFSPFSRDIVLAPSRRCGLGRIIQPKPRPFVGKELFAFLERALKVKKKKKKKKILKNTENKGKHAVGRRSNRRQSRNQIDITGVSFSFVSNASLYVHNIRERRQLLASF
jgi:hypothetical protein